MDRTARAQAVAFCERVRPRLVGALSLYCGDADLAEEYAQEALTRVWEHWERVRQMDAPEAWALRVGMNAIHSVFRRRVIERRVLARVSSRESPADRRSSDGLDAEHVRHAVAALPRRQREALVLRYYLDMSVIDSARQMGCAEGTVKSLTSKAIEALRSVPGLSEQQEVQP